MVTAHETLESLLDKTDAIVDSVPTTWHEAVAGPAREAALAAAQEVLNGTLTTRRTRDIPVTPDEGAIEAKAAELEWVEAELRQPG